MPAHGRRRDRSRNDQHGRRLRAQRPGERPARRGRPPPLAERRLLPPGRRGAGSATRPRRRRVVDARNTISSIKRLIGPGVGLRRAEARAPALPVRAEGGAGSGAARGRPRAGVHAARDQRLRPPPGEADRRPRPRRGWSTGPSSPYRPTSTSCSARRPRWPVASRGSTSCASSTSRPRRRSPTASGARPRSASPSTTSAAARSTARCSTCRATCSRSSPRRATRSSAATTSTSPSPTSMARRVPARAPLRPAHRPASLRAPAHLGRGAEGRALHARAGEREAPRGGLRGRRRAPRSRLRHDARGARDPRGAAGRADVRRLSGGALGGAPAGQRLRQGDPRRGLDAHPERATQGRAVLRGASPRPREPRRGRGHRRRHPGGRADRGRATPEHPTAARPATDVPVPAPSRRRRQGRRRHAGREGLVAPGRARAHARVAASARGGEAHHRPDGRRASPASPGRASVLAGSDPRPHRDAAAPGAVHAAAARDARSGHPRGARHAAPPGARSGRDAADPARLRRRPAGRAASRLAERRGDAPQPDARPWSGRGPSARRSRPRSRRRRRPRPRRSPPTRRRRSGSPSWASGHRSPRCRSRCRARPPLRRRLRRRRPSRARPR